MYKLNNIPLGDYGFIPGQQQGSNLGIAGCWDMPKRMGKTFHSWGDEDGIEPYVDEEELRFEGRNIRLVGYIKRDTKTSALNSVQDLYELINGFSDLVELSSDWGNWQVYVNEPIEVKYLGLGTALIKMTFREPVVNLTPLPVAPSELTALAISSDSILINWVNNNAFGAVYELSDIVGISNVLNANGIDGVDFSSIGIDLLSISDPINRPEPKAFESTSWLTEGYFLSKISESNMELNLLITGSSYEEFKRNLGSITYMLTSSGLRYLTVDNAAICSFFCEDGFRLSQVNLSNNKVTGIINLVINYQILIPPPPAPSDLAAIAISNSQINLNWINN